MLDIQLSFARILSVSHIFIYIVMIASVDANRIQTLVMQFAEDNSNDLH